MGPVAKVWIKQLETQVFISRSVNELLWGYEDPLLMKAASFKKVETNFGFMLNVSFFYSLFCLILGEHYCL